MKKQVSTKLIKNYEKCLSRNSNKMVTMNLFKEIKINGKNNNIIDILKDKNKGEKEHIDLITFSYYSNKTNTLIYTYKNFCFIENSLSIDKHTKNNGIKKLKLVNIIMIII